MNELMKADGTMSSLDLRGIVNEARKAHGQKPIRNDDFVARIEAMIQRGYLVVGSPFYVKLQAGGPPRKCYLLDEHAQMVVLAKESPEALGRMVERMRHSSSALNKVIEALNAFEVDPDIAAEMPDAIVYAIRERETGNIKIGISRDPERRLNQLQTGNSSTLELVATKRADGFEDETDAHALNSAIRIRGEWFAPNASIDGPMGKLSLVEKSA